jgi:hypothetical protein
MHAVAEGISGRLTILSKQRNIITHGKYTTKAYFCQYKHAFFQLFITKKTKKRAIRKPLTEKRNTTEQDDPYGERVTGI